MVEGAVELGIANRGQTLTVLSLNIYLIKLGTEII